MAEKTTSGDAGKAAGGQGAAGSGATSAPAKEPRKLPEDFKANEPTSKSGLDKEGKPDGTLSPKQLERAGAEALLALRPQPSKKEMEGVLAKLKEVDKDGQPKIKVKTAKEGGEKAVSLL